MDLPSKAGHLLRIVLRLFSGADIYLSTYRSEGRLCGKRIMISRLHVASFIDWCLGPRSTDSPARLNVPGLRTSLRRLCALLWTKAVPSSVSKVTLDCA